MSYKNPIPMILDDYVSKEIIIAFSFDSYVTLEEAATGITNLIQEAIKSNGGVIPYDWIRMKNPTLCIELKEYEKMCEEQK